MKSKSSQAPGGQGDSMSKVASGRVHKAQASKLTKTSASRGKQGNSTGKENG